MKNLLNPEVKADILKRVDTITPEHKSLWGKMNSTQSLRHMAMAFQTATGEVKFTRASESKIPKWLMKFFLLSMKPPKGGAETFLEMKMVENKTPLHDFETERKNLKQAICDFGSKEFLSENTLAGKFTRDDWGKLNYNHTDHHLRQFGV